MSEDRQEPTNAIKPEPTDQEIADSWSAGGDDFLRTWVDLVAGSDIDIGITLSVGGLLISGRLASGHRYYADFDTAFTKDLTGDAGQLIRDMLAERAALYEDQPDRRLAPTYIHVRQARFFLPTGQRGIPTSPTSETWWRGRIDAVDGWMLGELREGE